MLRSIVIGKPVWFVCLIKWQIRHYDWSDRLSIKLSVKGALGGGLMFFIKDYKCKSNFFYVLIATCMHAYKGPSNKHFNSV